MHYANLKKAHSKRYILYDSIDTTFWKRQTYRDRKQFSGCQGLGVGGQDDHKGAAQGNLGDDDLFCILIMVVTI